MLFMCYLLQAGKLISTGDTAHNCLRTPARVCADGTLSYFISFPNMYMYSEYISINMNCHSIKV